MSETDSARKSYFGIHASILFLYGGGSRVETLSNTHNSQKRIQTVESDTFCFLFGKFELGRGFLHVSQTIPRLKVTLGYTLRFYSGAPMRLVSKRSPAPNSQFPNRSHYNHRLFYSYTFWLLFGKLELGRGFLHESRPIPRAKGRLPVCSCTTVGLV